MGEIGARGRIVDVADGEVDALVVGGGGTGAGGDRGAELVGGVDADRVAADIIHVALVFRGRQRGVDGAQRAVEGHRRVGRAVAAAGEGEAGEGGEGQH